MVEQQSMKVYELAKELGVDSISLLDKLKDLNIKVKNHMSDLNSDEVRVARTSLGKKSESAGASAKKAPVKARKKATPTAAEAPAAGATAKSTTAKASTTAKSSASAAAKEAAAAAALAAEKKAASPVIRRRVKSDGATETVSTEIIGGAPAPTREAREQDGSQQYVEGEMTAEEWSEAQAQQDAESEASAEVEAADAGSEAEIYSEEPGMESSDEIAAQGGAQAADGPVTDLSGDKAAATPQRPSRAPIVLPPRPVAPRRSILKIVEHATPIKPTVIKQAPPTPAGGVVKPAVRGVTTQDKDGFRIIKMTKENLDQMVEEEAAKKRGGGREAEIRPEDVRFADYRKKEMVFLPKKKKLPVGKELKRTQMTTPKAGKRIVEMEETISVQNLASQLGIKAVEVIRKMMGMGQMATINQAVDFDTATLLAAEYQFEVRNVAFKEESLIPQTADTDEQLLPRPPVVTIMGHVDHGKTSLLDAIREANVAGGEAGGITQHIGAYTIKKDGKLITFVDTPGHEAFTAMRARGANVTDIVILVVAADDGVMPQTREAASHAQAAGVPIIVAVNKIDKPQANPEKVKQGLSEINLLAEDWGGQTMFIPVSAVKKTNLDKLLEAILLQAEVLELRANPNTRASGHVLEARLEKGRGPMVSLLVKRGTLRVGDGIVASQHAGKVKAMSDASGKAVKEAGPGFAVEVLGFEGVPNAGDPFDSTETEADARVIAGKRIDTAKAKALNAGGKVSLDDLFAKIQTGNLKELNIVLKADVFGSTEAVRDSLVKLSNDQIKVKVILAAAGGITESDVLLASASSAVIIGFNVRPETKARQLAESEHVEIKCYSIIYELLDDVKKSMVGLLDKKKVEKFLGRAEVRQTFTVPKIGTIAGSAVIDGKIIRGANVRLLRDSRIIYEGKMHSLKRFKDDAKEVASGFECGIGLENYNDVKPGDLIEAYQIDLVTPELNANTQQ